MSFHVFIVRLQCRLHSKSKHVNSWEGLGKRVKSVFFILFFHNTVDVCSVLIYFGVVVVQLGVAGSTVQQALATLHAHFATIISVHQGDF